MVEDYDENANADDGGMTGPGAPTPLSALEVGPLIVLLGHFLYLMHYLTS